MNLYLVVNNHSTAKLNIYFVFLSVHNFHKELEGDVSLPTTSVLLKGFKAGPASGYNPDPVQRRRGYHMSITQRYPVWYVEQLGLPHLGVPVISTQIKHPVSSIHLATAFISTLNILIQERGLLITAMDNSGSVHIYLIENPVALIYSKLGHIIYK